MHTDTHTYTYMCVHVRGRGSLAFLRRRHCPALGVEGWRRARTPPSRTHTAPGMPPWGSCCPCAHGLLTWTEVMTPASLSLTSHRLLLGSPSLPKSHEEVATPVPELGTPIHSSLLSGDSVFPNFLYSALPQPCPSGPASADNASAQGQPWGDRPALAWLGHPANQVQLCGAEKLLCCGAGRGPPQSCQSQGMIPHD